MKMPAFAKRIRFRLTMWTFGLIVLMFTLMIVAVTIAAVETFSGAEDEARYEAARESIKAVPDGEWLLENEERFVARFANYTSLVWISLLVLGVIGAYFISGRMVKPVDRITALASNISHTNLAERINHRGPQDELKNLADTFDDMVGRLEAAFDSQKQLIQDASHELRTPIAIAQTNIEVLQLEENPSAEDYENMMEVLSRTLERMKNINDSLLMLSEESQLEPAEVDIGSLIEETVSDYEAVSAVVSVNLKIENAVDNLTVKGDPIRLKQIVANLVDNGIKYNQSGGSVKVSAKAEKDEVIVEVKDTGFGISEEDLPFVFDRFFRVDKSRSRELGGSGLGLAIVKKIVEDHGGTITIKSVLNEGTAFWIRLPQHHI